MCFFVVITEAFPDYKRPWRSVDTKVCKDMSEVEEYKKQFTIEWKQDNPDLLDTPDQDIWDEEFIDSLVDKKDCYMDNDYLSFQVTECICCKN